MTRRTVFLLAVFGLLVVLVGLVVHGYVSCPPPSWVFWRRNYACIAS